MPQKLVEISMGGNPRKFYGDVPWEHWGPIAKAGMRLAVLRLSKQVGPLLEDYGEYPKNRVDWALALAELHGDATTDVRLAMSLLEMMTPERPQNSISTLSFSIETGLPIETPAIKINDLA